MVAAAHLAGVEAVLHGGGGNQSADSAVVCLLALDRAGVVAVGDGANGYAANTSKVFCADDLAGVVTVGDGAVFNKIAAYTCDVVCRGTAVQCCSYNSGRTVAVGDVCANTNAANAGNLFTAIEIGVHHAHIGDVANEFACRILPYSPEESYEISVGNAEVVIESADGLTVAVEVVILLLPRNTSNKEQIKAMPCV